MDKRQELCGTDKSRQRSRLTSLAVAAALVATGASAAHAASGPQSRKCLGLPEAKVAIQTYVFMGELMQIKLPPGSDSLPPMKKFEKLGWLFSGAARQPTPADVDAVFATIRQIGYRNIEESSFTGQFTSDDYAALLKRSGLRAVASHESLEAARWEQTLAKAKTAGQKLVGSGSWGSPGPDTLEHVLATARMLNERGKAAADQGLVFYIHNHAGEFTSRFPYDHGDGKPVMTSAWEIVAANTDPRYVSFELDVYWAREAFGLGNTEELLDFLKKYRSRIVLLHMKDTAPSGVVADLGAGTTDWRAVVHAAGPGIRYYVYEFDLPENPMRAAQVGFEYLTCRKAGGR